MKAQELSIVKPVVTNDKMIDSVANRIAAEYDENKDLYDRFSEMRENTVVNGSNVRRATIWVVGSIKTDTQIVDDGADEIIAGNLGKDKAFLEATHDGETKWDRYGPWFASDIPDRIAELLQDGRVMDAHALLSGRDPSDGSQVGEYYLRANKASLVLYLLGFNRTCVDTRVYRCIKPAIRCMLNNRHVAHPESEDPMIGKPEPNPYRNSAPRMDAKEVPVMSHSGDLEWDREKSYWEDKLKWNPKQYHVLTDMIMTELAERADVPRDVVAQVAFNTEGNTTDHAGLLRRLT